MGSITAFLMVTADGCYEGVDGAFDFWTVDEGFERFSDGQLDEFDTLVFGRRTFEGMAEFWPTRDAIEASPETARRMNTKPKLVVSRTLTSVKWSPTDIVDTVDELARRRDPDGAMLVLGSPHLVGSLLEVGLVDELRLMVNPVAVGGASLADAFSGRVDLDLVNVEQFESGNVLLRHQPTGPRRSDA